ncbi:MAG: thiamine-phosphate kinase [Verrucomicrobia bacterium]|nr:thiamine-phosphate kinase [Verrucomicrobiota bacterium]
MNPFSDQKAEQIIQLGERNLIQSIAEWLGSCSPPSPAGIGDDAAVINLAGTNLVVTIDSLVLDKHFNASTPPSLAGQKLLKRNISDLAAMGAQPSHAVLACLLPTSTSVEWLKGFYLGLREAAEAYSIALVGGDITSTFQDLAFTLTLFGSGAEKSLTRKTSKPGDTLWVTGTLGGSLLGKHLDFEPRLKEGLWLASQTGVTSAMDVSDGLATDLLNLCPDNCSIDVDTDSIPISDAAIERASTTNRNPIEHALEDGEDYELLFTLWPEVHPIEFLTEWKESFSTPLTCIGKINTHPPGGLVQVKYSGSFSHYKGQGYEHF